MKNFFNAVARILKPDPNKIGDTGFTRLQRAILNNDLGKVVSLLRAGADVNLRGQMILPPLHYAIEKGHQDIALALLQAGADVNLPDSNGQTPLHKAVEHNLETFVLALLKMGADPNLRDKNGRTPAHVASLDNPAVFRVLTEHGALINAQDGNGNTPLHRFLNYAHMVEHLLICGADPNIRNNRGASPYMMMLDDGMLLNYPKTLRFFLAYKADLGSTNGLGETVLHLSARLELSETFEDIVSRCDLNVQDNNGNNVLHALARTQNEGMLGRVLKAAPALVNQKNRFGRTPLGEIVQRADARSFGLTKKIVNAACILITAGAHPDAVDEKGRTLLHHAVEQKNMTVAEYLVLQRINLDIVDGSGHSALHLAIEAKNMEMLDFLLDAGADPDLTDDRGWTILDRLAERNDRDSPAVQRLIVAGGQYKKQLPLNPEQMRKRPTIDKGRHAGPRPSQ